MYDRPIIIEKRTKGKNALGTPVSSWVVLKNKFCHVSYKGGNTGTLAEGERVRTDITFTIRHDPAVNYDCRVIFEGDIYRIRHIERQGRQEKMKLACVMFEQEDE
jgi:SPP1 family predicted phage head-tail adaptor